jgi:hypothetical protein
MRSSGASGLAQSQVGLRTTFRLAIWLVALLLGLNSLGLGNVPGAPAVDARVR